MTKKLDNFLIAYDLKSTDPDPHSEFRKQAEPQGLSNWIEINGELCQLPNTTLYGSFESRDFAVAAFDRALHATRSKIKGEVVLTARCVVRAESLRVLPKAKRSVRADSGLAGRLEGLGLKM